MKETEIEIGEIEYADTFTSHKESYKFQDVHVLISSQSTDHVKRIYAL